jgi:hypothetical protein
MNEIRKLWDEIRNALHYGPNTQPLWQSVIDKMHEFEARLAALEAHPAVSIPPLAPVVSQVEQPKPAEDVKTVDETKPTEQVIQSDKTDIHDDLTKVLGGDQFEDKKTAAEGANDSSGTGDPAVSPSANPSLEKAAGPEGGEQEHHDGGHEGHE